MSFSDSTSRSVSASPGKLGKDVESLDLLMNEFLDALSDAHAAAIIVLGPSVTSEDGTRKVLAIHARDGIKDLGYSAELLASCGEFLSWDGPLVAWQDVHLADFESDWRHYISSAGLASFVRVAFELSGNRFFEFYTFTKVKIQSRSQAALIAWAIYGSWPRIRRAIMTRRLRLSPRELEVLFHLCVGLTSKEIGTKIQITERTVNHFIGSLSEKFCVSGRSALPQRAFWLGFLDALPPLSSSPGDQDAQT